MQGKFKEAVSYKEREVRKKKVEKYCQR